MLAKGCVALLCLSSLTSPCWQCWEDWRSLMVSCSHPGCGSSIERLWIEGWRPCAFPSRSSREEYCLDSCLMCRTGSQAGNDLSLKNDHKNNQQSEAGHDTGREQSPGYFISERTAQSSHAHDD